MIRHYEQSPTADAFVFANVGGFTCSICAPSTMTEHEVETFAHATLGDPKRPLEVADELARRRNIALDRRWHCVDKSRAGMGEQTPNLCSMAPGRTHHFLVDAFIAATVFGLTP